MKIFEDLNGGMGAPSSGSRTILRSLRTLIELCA